MPETLSIDGTPATSTPSLSKTNEEWIEKRLSYWKGQKATGYNGRHTRVRERLAELRRLRPGWMDGEGVAPSSGALDVVERALDSHLADLVESPQVFPTLDGGVQLEWFLQDRYHVAVEIDAGAGTGDIGIVDMKTREDDTLDLFPSSSSSWRKVVRLIEKHS